MCRDHRQVMEEDTASMGPQPSSRGNRFCGVILSCAILASMGPQPSSRGNFGESPDRQTANRFKLQWGRNLPVAEINRVCRRWTLASRASMGPQPSSRGNRQVANARIKRLATASMGPQPSSRGNLCRRYLNLLRLYAASMGPQPSSRGNACADAGNEQSGHCFNGAATFQSRKFPQTF